MATMVATDPAAASGRLRPVRIWLYVIALLVLLMVALGGITRLTESGLSITEWKPVSGVIPPLSESDWAAEFEAYKRIPQYTELNAGMSLAEFQYIFWWEWAHRLLGRIIGFAFAVPFVIFLFQKRFSWSLAGPLAALFVLGGLQGALGWWMVSSGLTELTSVSQYRLAAHLFAASILFVALIWVARRLEPAAPMTSRMATRWPIVVLLALVIVQIVSGAFVAGLDAGLAYNTWPLMGDTFVPTAYAEMDPFWRNLFENVAAVQFNHRIVAYAIFGYVWLLVWQRRRARFAGAEGWLPRIALLVSLQLVLGVGTVLYGVPIWLALGHQALAFMLAGAITAYLADLSPRYSDTAN